MNGPGTCFGSAGANADPGTEPAPQAEPHLYIQHRTRIREESSVLEEAPPGFCAK